MSYTKCAYRNCNNISRDVSLFRFPIKDKDRLAIWIRNSGNMFLTSLTEQELGHRYICSAHFSTSSIHQGMCRSRLIGPAVPVPFQCDGAKQGTSATSTTHEHMETDVSPKVLKVKTPKKFYSRRVRTPISLEPEKSLSPASSVFSGPLPSTPTRRISRKCLFEGPKKRLSHKFLMEESVNDTPQTKRRKQLASTLYKKNIAQHAKIRRLQAKSKRPIKKFVDEESFRSEVSKTLALMQLRKKSDTRKWTKKEKNFCLSLFYKSPSAYYFLLRQGVVLAAPSTIRSWLSKSNCAPGLSSEVFGQLKKRFENSSIKEKACVVCFDEMSIMTSLEYSKKYDLIEGFEDLGGGRRTSKVAKYALVFVVRALYNSWKLPVAYFLSNCNVKAETLQFLLKATLNKLFDHGLLPKAIVCDQMSTNQKIFKTLGVSSTSPFFFCNGRKIFALFDVPHLIKNVRNNFLNNNFLHENVEMSFQDIKNTYELDKKSEKSRALTKITDAHINPNPFQKMNVRLATQIFSRSVSAAIQTAKSTGEIPSATAMNTANFVNVVNDMFDALNSAKQYNKNPCKHALSEKSRYVKQAILDGRDLFKNLQKVTFKTNKAGQCKRIVTRPPCFDGVVQSCEAVLQLFSEESTEKSVKYLITKKLNQDVIENLFARFRQKGGSNRNPTAKLLRTIFRSNLINSLIKLPSSKNCEDEDDEFIDLQAGQPSCSTRTPEEQANVLVPSTENSLLGSTSAYACSSSHVDEKKKQIVQKSFTSSTIINASVDTTLEECSINYFSGYLVKSCIDKNNCKICIENLTKSEELMDEKQLLILHKSYKFNTCMRLKMPSEKLVQFVSLVIDQFNIYFENMLHLTNIKAQIFESILNFLRCEAPELLNISCEEHLHYIIKQIMLVKIFFYCKSIKTNVLVRKPHPKLRILKNK